MQFNYFYPTRDKVEIQIWQVIRLSFDPRLVREKGLKVDLYVLYIQVGSMNLVPHPLGFLFPLLTVSSVSH